MDNDFNMFVRFKIISQESKDNRDLTVTVVYRPPRPTSRENNMKMYKLFKNSNENNIFVGDYNFPAINWNEYTSDRGSEPFLKCLVESGYEQLVDFPTHIQGNILDLVLTNKPEDILSVDAIGNLGNSDHMTYLSRYCLNLNLTNLQS